MSIPHYRTSENKGEIHKVNTPEPLYFQKLQGCQEFLINRMTHTERYEQNYQVQFQRNSS